MIAEWSANGGERLYRSDGDIDKNGNNSGSDVASIALVMATSPVKTKWTAFCISANDKIINFPRKFQCKRHNKKNQIIFVTSF